MSMNFAVENISIEDKVAQLFVATPESLVNSEDPILVCDRDLEEVLQSISLGGILYFGRNLVDPSQVKDLLKKTQLISSSRFNLPLFQCIDEEGGDVSRVANREAFGVENIGKPFELSKTVSIEQIYEKGKYVGAYLSSLGFNVDFAPCVDVLTNPRNTVIGDRAYGSDPQIVAEYADSFARGLMSERVIPSFKHFPGHGNTDGDSHLGYAYTSKTLDDLFECELIPFEKGINSDIPMIMVGHISLPNVTGDDEPASLSHKIISDLLRGQLGYNGLVITDSLKMKAISDVYSPEEAAIKVIEAGADIILRPIDFFAAYKGVVDAVKQGRIYEERIDESLKRILLVKELLDI